MKKSKREKEKEREEAKKKEEEELAAKAYAEYVEAFEGDGAKRKSNTFVRAGESSTRSSQSHSRSHGEGMRAFERERSVSSFPRRA